MLYTQQVISQWKDSCEIIRYILNDLSLTQSHDIWAWAAHVVSSSNWKPGPDVIDAIPYKAHTCHLISKFPWSGYATWQHQSSVLQHLCLMWYSISIKIDSTTSCVPKNIRLSFELRLPGGHFALSRKGVIDSWPLLKYSWEFDASHTRDSRHQSVCNSRIVADNLP